MTWRPIGVTDTCKSAPMWNPHQPKTGVPRFLYTKVVSPIFFKSDLKFQDIFLFLVDNFNPKMERNLRSKELVNDAEDSFLTVQNGGDVLRRLANVAAPDDCTAWTNEKHNLYLNNLEVSFVTQLHESRDLVNKNMTQKKPTKSPEQHGCWRKIDHKREELLSCPTADSHNCMKNAWIYFHHPSLSVDLQSDTEKHSSRKGIISHGLATCSQQVSTMNLYHANSFDSMKEGTGQNYVNHEDNDQPNLWSGLKR